MKSIVYLIVPIAVLSIVCASTVSAQGNGGDLPEFESEEQNFFFKDTLKQYGVTDGGTAEEKTEIDNYTSANTIFQNAGKYSVLPFRRRDKEEDERIDRSEQKTGEITHQLPLHGQQMLQNSDAMRQMLDNGLDGVMTLFKITAHQTEPAEAAGAQGAEMTAALLQNNIYASQQLFFTQYLADPQVYRNSMTMYSRCMSEKTSENSNTGSWLAAVTRCLGDGVKSDTAGPTDLAPDAEQAYAGKHHPSLQIAGEDRDALRVTDMLFNEAEAANVPFIDEYKRSWLELFGDYEIELTVENAAGGAGAAQNFVPVRAGVTTRIYPADENGDRSDLKMFTEKRVDARFKVLREVMHRYCRDVIEGGFVDATVPFDSAPTVLHSDDVDFFLQALEEEYWQVLSVPGQPLRIATLQAFFQAFSQRFPEEDSALDCDLLDPGVSIQQLSDVGGDYAQYLEFFAALRMYARYIAEGQTIMTVMQAEQFVNDRASNFGMDPDVREYALRLIYEAANTNNLQAVQQEHIAVMQQFLQSLFEFRAQQSGKAQSKTTTVGSRDGDSQ